MFRPIMLLVLVLSFAASAIAGGTEPKPLVPCKAGEECAVEGELRLYREGPAAVGVIRDEKTCVTLALPPHVTRNSGKWNRVRVKASGVAYIQPNAPELTWYEIRNRKVAANACASSTVIYVEKIEQLK